MTPDGKLVRQALAGRRKAYDKLVHRWSGRVLALCHARTGRADVGEDLAQETLLRGFLALRSLSDPEKFGAWLCGIATRVCLDWFKARRRAHVPFSDLGGHWEPASVGETASVDVTKTEKEEEVSVLLSEVAGLPDELREVLMLYYYEDRTYRELADLLGVSPATINARLTKGRALLRRRLSASRR